MLGNPATLGLRKQGNNFGIGLTVLQPDVSASSTVFGSSSDSEGTSFLIPSISFIRKDGDFTYGVGVIGQGGMGAEYSGSSFLAQGTGLPQMSQVSFGRVMFPLAYQATKELSIAAQVDYIFTSMDLQRLTPPNPLAPMGGYVNVKDDSDFTGQMTGSGFAFNLGAVYQFNEEFSVGATYRSESNIDDLTGSGTFTAFTPQGSATLPANYTVNDFQWPATFGIGMAWNVTPELLVAADIKQLMWSQTLSEFSFTTEIPGFGGGTGVERQDWSDQTVFAIGAQYKIDPAVALRIGYNYGANPVPDDTINYLFPAITEQHFSFGVGWQIDKANSLSAAFTYAPEVTQTAVAPNQLAPLEISHSQTLWRLNYAYSF
jgi:long-chain fatty acid transport protein